MHILKGNSGRGSKKGSDMLNCANTRHLTRIICILKEFKRPMNYTELKNYTGITSRLSDGIRWLLNHGIIEVKKNDGATIHYTIKEKEGTKND